MASINPIAQPLITVASSPSKSPTGNPSNLPVSGQIVPPDTQKTQLTGESLHQMVDKLQEYTSSQKRNISFRVDEISNRAVVTVVNTETNEVIRQIPSEEMLALAHRLESNMGAILDILV